MQNRKTKSNTHKRGREKSGRVKQSDRQIDTSEPVLRARRCNDTPSHTTEAWYKRCSVEDKRLAATQGTRATNTPFTPPRGNMSVFAAETLVTWR